jgi:hypothetical protein
LRKFASHELFALRFTVGSHPSAQDAPMRELLDLIRANPWPFGAGLLVVILMIMAENFGRGIQGGGDAGSGDFSDVDAGDGGGGD